MLPGFHGFGDAGRDQNQDVKTPKDGPQPTTNFDCYPELLTIDWIGGLLCTGSILR